jgi:MORN repeat.
LVQRDKKTVRWGFFNGEIHGNGTLTMTDGSEYKGELEYGKISGNGK